MSAYLEKNSAHAQISENAKIASVIVSFFSAVVFKWIREIFHKRLRTKFLMVLENAMIFLTELGL